MDLMHPFANPREPLSYVAEQASRKKRKKCDYCRKYIAPDETLVEVRFYAGSSVYTIHQECFSHSGMKQNYTEYYLKNAYSIEDFKEYDGFFYKPYQEVIKNFDFDTALTLIADPPLLHHPVVYRSCLISPEEAEFEGRLRASPGASWFNQPIRLLSIMVMCGMRQGILDCMERLPSHSWILIAMHDAGEGRRTFGAARPPRSARSSAQDTACTRRYGVCD